jgi:hypothetical protein
MRFGGGATKPRRGVHLFSRHQQHASISSLRVRNATQAGPPGEVRVRLAKPDFDLRLVAQNACGKKVFYDPVELRFDLPDDLLRRCAARIIHHDSVTSAWATRAAQSRLSPQHGLRELAARKRGMSCGYTTAPCSRNNHQQCLVLYLLTYTP